MNDSNGKMVTREIPPPRLRKRQTETPFEQQGVAIVATAELVNAALRAADELREENVFVDVIQRPSLEAAALIQPSELAAEAKAVLILEDGTERNGSGKSKNGGNFVPDLPVPVRRLQLTSHANGLPPDQKLNANVTAVVRGVRGLMRPEKQYQFSLPNKFGRIDTTRNSPNSKLKEVGRESETDGYFGFSEKSLKLERDAVRSAELSPSVETWFDIYSEVGRRPRFLWQWCVHGAELTTIPAVLPVWRSHLCDTKVLSIMLCVLLDDVADEEGNEPLLDILMQIIAGEPLPSMQGFSSRDRRCAEVTFELVQIYESRVSLYSLYEVYKRLLQFDLLQYFNTMRYSCLLNENLSLLNVTEHELYLPHAMHMMSFSTLDLMCTPDFQVHELGRFRELIWHTQCMGRVGNLLSTWRREIAQTDFTSGVFARAVVNGDLEVSDLYPGNASVIEDAIVDGGHETYFLSKWYEHREHLKAKVDEVHSIDLKDFVESQERFFRMHLACRGAI